MEQYLNGKALLEKIGTLLEAVQDCILVLSPTDIDNLQKCILSLFHFHQSYLDGWNNLNQSLNQTSNMKNNGDSEILRKKYEEFLKEIENKI